MVNPPMPSRRTEFSHRAIRWLWPATLLFALRAQESDRILDGIGVLVDRLGPQRLVLIGGVLLALEDVVVDQGVGERDLLQGDAEIDVEVAHG